MSWIDEVKGAIWLAMLVASFSQVLRHWPGARSQSAAASRVAATQESLAIYGQAAESMRHYAGLRFAQLTVLVAISTALAGTIVLAPLSPYVRAWLALVAMGTTGLFLVMQERAVDHWKHAFRTAAAIETEWGRRMFLDWEEARVFSATNAIRVLHLLFGLLWLLVLG